MTTSGETIAAMSASDVALAGNEIALGESFYAIADKVDNPDELVPDRHRHRDRFLRPRVPVIYMYVGPADRGLEHADEHVVIADFGNGNFFKPKPGVGLALHHRLHLLLHEKKLGESSKQESRKKLVGARVHIPFARRTNCRSMRVLLALAAFLQDDAGCMPATLEQAAPKVPTSRSVFVLRFLSTVALWSVALVIDRKSTRLNSSH